METMQNFEQTEQQGPPAGLTNPGGTVVDKKKPVYDVNRGFVQERAGLYTKNLTDFVQTAFQVSNTLPKVNGKTIQSIDQLPALIEKHGDDLYKQAKSVLSNPDLTDEDAERLVVRQKLVDDSFGQLAQANKVINEDMLNSAKTLETKTKNREKGKSDGYYTILFTSDGRLKGKTQAEKDLQAAKQKYIAEGMKAWREANPPPQNAPLFWQRTDMPNPMAGKVVKDPVTGKMVQLDPRPKMINSQEGYAAAEAMQLEILNNKFRDWNYDKAYKEVTTEYNDNTKTRKIQAAQENIFKDNAGGAKTVMQKAEFRFDIDRALTDDMKDRNPDLVNAIEFLETVSAGDASIRFAQGTLSSNTAAVPKESDEASMKMLQVALEQFKVGMLDQNRKKGADNRFAGSISFVPLAGGDEKYHAYHIKFNQGFFKDHLGTEKNPGVARNSEGINHKFITDGITVFVPKEASQKLTIGRESTKGTRISPVESMIALSPDNSFSRKIDDGMEYKITLDKKTGKYILSGNAVLYNPSTAKMDTLNINDLGFQSSYDLTVDIDEIEKKLFLLGLDRLKINRARRREHTAIQGVKNPQQLSGQ